ncbi:hypothetical protein SAMN05660359_02361 [Geodermatophilus obscurus]|uniref:Uncharacterized protein n=1 Tax=Geodermatophilus obscurus TaxID=1861 RepID=A0A1I5FSG2_9ACTN|nr:hypothetical protein [Geodermatophilus obscurus]SFO26546.1 hypothetical protein SAMN05660359_02361 [Geodermatophilus obscurus]
MTAPAPRPPSPWPGSRHETVHRWQLDDVGSLAEAVERLTALAAELRAAHAAGWAPARPMRDGHLLATRPSRRERARGDVVVPLGAGEAPPLPRWRVRVVDEPLTPGDEVLDLAAVPSTVVVAWADGAPRQVAGPAADLSLLGELGRQVAAAEAAGRRWAVVPARVGPVHDLVAEGSALRVHGMVGGALVRTVEALTFRHAADRAATLADAAAAYERLAGAAATMAAAGGRLTDSDDGLLHVRYGR